MKAALQHALVATLALSAATAASAGETPPASKAAPGAAAPAAPPAAAAAPAAPAAATISAEQASVLIGITFGQQLKSAALTQDLSLEAILRGLKDGIGGRTLTSAENQQMGQYVRAAREAVGVRNAGAARDFLDKNKQQNGITATASGLQYKVVAAGNAKAASPQADDQVSVKYTGKLIDGTEFDSSKGQPVTFPANRVIKGWQEALLLMKPGSQFQLFIPPELAYGMEGRQGIPPGSLLIFDVELVSVQPAAKPADAPVKAPVNKPK